MARHTADLEEVVARLAAAVARLEERVARLEAAGTTRASESATTPERAGGEPRWQAQLGGVPALVGRTLVVLAGAFLLRAPVESALIPGPVGVVLGFAYAALWLVAADRSGARGAAVSSGFHGVVFAVIAFPILVEATSRFGVLSATSSGLALAVITASVLTVAWRQELHFLAWTAAVAGALTAFALVVTTHSIVAAAWVLILLLLASEVLAGRKGWTGPRWLVAVVTDVMVVELCVLASRPEGPPPAYGDLAGGSAVVVACALVLVSAGIAAAKALRRSGAVGAFEVIQTAVALIVGLGGAIRVTGATGSYAVAVAIAATALGLVTFALALTRTEASDRPLRTLLFVGSLGLVLVMTGSSVLAGTGGAAILWSAMAVLAAALGGRSHRLPLHLHTAVLLTGAAFQGGLAGASWSWLAASVQQRPVASPTATGVVVLIAAAVSYLVLARSHQPATVLSRLPRLAVAALVLAGVGGVAVFLLAQLLGAAGADAEPGLMAAIRTVILCAAAVTLALAGRRERVRELAWLAVPVLAMAGTKLVLEDLRVGSPSNLFVAFAACGVALTACSRLLRRTHDGGGSQDQQGHRDAPPLQD